MLVDIHRVRRTLAILFAALWDAGSSAYFSAGGKGQLTLTISSLELEILGELGGPLEREVGEELRPRSCQPQAVSPAVFGGAAVVVSIGWGKRGGPL